MLTQQIHSTIDTIKSIFIHEISQQLYMSSERTFILMNKAENLQLNRNNKATIVGLKRRNCESEPRIGTGKLEIQTRLQLNSVGFHGFEIKNQKKKLKSVLAE